MQLRRHASVDDFLAVAGAYLAEREAEHNLILGVASMLRTTPEAFTGGDPSFATVAGADGRLQLAALRTPPFNLVLSEVLDPAAIDILAAGLRDDPLPGAIGPKPVAARFAARWHEATAASATVVMEERIFAIERVVPPERPAPGRWRIARPGDRELVARWLSAFVAETAVPDQPPIVDPLVTADRWIAGRGRLLYLWEERKRPVSLVGASGETPRGIRIGPVYTPPDARGHGYATSLTAAATQDQLDRGRQFAFLFTDLANPTSNHIYQSIGYRPVTDVDMYAFRAATIPA